MVLVQVPQCARTRRNTRSLRRRTGVTSQDRQKSAMANGGGRDLMASAGRRGPQLSPSYARWDQEEERDREVADYRRYRGEQSHA